jgi:thiamine monophosphate synthase
MILVKPPAVFTIDYIFAGSIFGTSRWKMPSAIKYADPEIINGMK